MGGNRRVPIEDAWIIMNILLYIPTRVMSRLLGVPGSFQHLPYQSQAAPRTAFLLGAPS